MPHERMAHISGVHHVNRIKGSVFEHDGHKTATPHVPGMDGKEEKEVEGLFGRKIGH